jgi:hypothetical protein
MAQGPDTVLLGNLALEEMDLRAIGRERGERIGVEARAGHAQESMGAVAEHGIEVDGPGRVGSVAEKSG